MASWQFWKAPEKTRRKSFLVRRTALTLEWLEDRSLLSGPSVARGYTLTTFATNPSGTSQPDSIALIGFGARDKKTMSRKAARLGLGHFSFWIWR